MSLHLGHVATLSIADLNFTVFSRNLPICHQSEDHYRHFITAGQSDELKDTVTVELLLEKIPDVSGYNKIFDTNGAWSLFDDGERKYIVFRGPEHDAHPLWVADIDLRNGHVDIYCSSRYKSTSNSGQQVIINPLSYPLDQILLMLFLGGNGFTVHAAGALYKGDG
jgi:hypothetical protein